MHFLIYLCLLGVWRRHAQAHTTSFIYAWKINIPHLKCENGSFMSRAFHTHLSNPHFLTSVCLSSFPFLSLFDFDPVSHMFHLGCLKKLISTAERKKRSGHEKCEKAIWQITRPWGALRDTPVSAPLGWEKCCSFPLTHIKPFMPNVYAAETAHHRYRFLCHRHFR